MPDFAWGDAHVDRLAAIRDDLARVSTATAYSMLFAKGWRNVYMQGILPIALLGRGERLVGRARTCQYQMRRGPVEPFNREARRTSPEILAIESLRYFVDSGSRTATVADSGGSSMRFGVAEAVPVPEPGAIQQQCAFVRRCQQSTD